MKGKFIPLFPTEVPMPEFGLKHEQLAIITRAKFYCYILDYIFCYILLFTFLFDGKTTNCCKRNSIAGVIILEHRLLTLCEWCTNEKGECKSCNRQFQTLNGQCGCCDPSELEWREGLLAFRKQLCVHFIFCSVVHFNPFI